MSEGVFYTHVRVDPSMTLYEVEGLLTYLDRNRSVMTHRYVSQTGTLYILVADHYYNLRYSDCPLPGSHDFATGWLACVAMHSISKYLNMPLYWQEAEFYKEKWELLPRRIRKVAKSPIKIDWEDWVESISTKPLEVEAEDGPGPNGEQRVPPSTIGRAEAVRRVQDAQREGRSTIPFSQTGGVTGPQNP